MDCLKREVNCREAANLVNKNNQRQEFPKQEQSRRYKFNYRNKPTGTASSLSTINMDSDEEARQVYHEAKLILSEASMNLTKWKTNSNALKEEIETITSRKVKLGDFLILLQKKYENNVENWCQNLQDIADFEISRWYFKNCDEIPHDGELHVFCDASQAAYGTVIYLRYVSASDIRTSFVISKGERERERRVASLKKLTLPRLELLAAVIAARLLCVVQPHFPSAKTYLWTDSLIVLDWIKSLKRWKQFVNNGVQEIKQKTTPANLYHCPGNQSPSDKITRGCSENSSICCDSEESCSMFCESDNYDNSESDIVPVFNCAVNKPILNIEYFSTLRRVCKKFHAKSGQQNIAPLPNDRIEKSQPFEITGVDFAGPLYLKDGSKIYIPLFTCAVTRNVHLELLSSLSTECFIQSLRIFFSRRVEAVINSRPLTYVYNDVNEPDPLTPSHFTVGSRLTTVPSPKLNANSINVELTKKWKYRQLLLDHFWKRFFKEYLLELRSVMFTKQSKNISNLKIDDVVLVRIMLSVIIGN
ncbi:uncharacterized protein TNCT_203861 [Trichonephila clavata]|uniref:DUF5641 domain-containing protein n=1 Tax=Trichonephila clavata TaxID=2740835 RepID=A0A8X6LS75_TRICU|nr:uncharacterized protein TNCT_203861 [Trichonephila clavata]